MVPIEIEGVTKRFGEVRALDGIGLDIEPGELFFLLGPSGCGKTTLLRSIAGFVHPDEGAIRIGGEDVVRMPPHKRRTSMVFQNYALWPHMSVADNVAFGLEQQKVAKAEREERVREALASVSMEQYGPRKPNTLSGGQQQRIALARALVTRPRCLLLDEPLSNLDAALRLRMRQEIRRVCKDHELTAVYVTHDQKEALSVADRLAVMFEGRVAQVGTPLEVYRRPVSKHVASFLGECNFITGEILRSGGGLAAVRTELGEFQGILGNPDLEPTDGQAVLLAIRPECFRLERMSTDEGNCLPGEVAEAVYYGEIAQYTFKTPQQDLKIFELNPRFLGRQGQRDLYAHVEPDDVVILEV